VEQAAKRTSETLDSGVRRNDGEGGVPREIKTVEDVLNAMQEAVERKLNILLTDPKAVTLRGLKELRDALAMIEDMKKKRGMGKEETKLLDAEAIKKIREQYL
jgi:hypothetical protein